MANVVRIIVSLGALLLVAACTPEFIQQKSAELAGQARLIDAVDVQRSNDRLLSRQASVCLVSENSDSGLLRTIQAGFSGYFVTVGVQSEPMDYLRAVSTAPCPGSSYLFYVQPLGQSLCLNPEDKTCNRDSHQWVITIVSNGDQSLVDRVKITVKNSLLPASEGDDARLQKAFEQVASTLTGGLRG
jgi:hypothetical protein